ncbi:MAG: PepSY domain-containing protein [Candidatus Sericytochromatia bacterium]|nr:PepSY domain-containing protein [Candidatus Sericytochromatia bacterium]
MKKSTRLIHKWTGLLSCVFILVVSITAIALNHHDFFSSFGTIKQDNTFSNSQIKKMAIDPFNNQHLIASDEDKSLFSSADSGKNWKKLELFVPTYKVNNISFDPFKKDNIILSLREAGVYISDDGGDVWDELKLPFFPNEGESIDNLSLGKDNIIIKTRFGFYTYNTMNKKWNKQLFDANLKSKILSNEEFIYNLHTGKIFGNTGIYIYDFISVGLIFLAISGIYLSIKPKRKFRVILDQSKNHDIIQLKKL